MDISFIHKLETALANDLPGMEAQAKMAPVHPERYNQVSDDHRIACVMIVIYPKNQEWHLCLIKRSTENPDDKHAGQLSFPGGQLDDQDDSYEDCALREIHEEVGIAPEDVGILGSLTPLYVFVSNFLVHPFVGFCSEYPDWKPQKSEVDEIIEVPVKNILKSKNKGLTDIIVRDTTIPKTPYYDIQNQKLWGATAMIMSELEHIIANIGLD
jgi:8-oxo-dGTP pyrophosphatase MutT (NUDIX family)